MSKEANKEFLDLLKSPNLTNEAKDALLIISRIEKSNGPILNLSSIGLTDDDLSIIAPIMVAKLPDLQMLNLSDNKLSTLPSKIKDFKSLRALRINKNQFSKIPRVIEELTKLVGLNANNNQISEVSDKVMNLPELERLVLKYNPLSQETIRAINTKFPTDKLTDKDITLKAVPSEDNSSVETVKTDNKDETTKFPTDSDIGKMASFLERNMALHNVKEKEANILKTVMNSGSLIGLTFTSNPESQAATAPAARPAAVKSSNLQAKKAPKFPNL